MTSTSICVTDRNPEFDPADIRGAARSDPRVTDTGDDEESLPGNYPTEESAGTGSSCATCWRSIPNDQVQCPHCATAQISESSVVDEGTVEEWSFGRVVIAVVPGISTYHARALGASAFSVSDHIVTESDVSHGDVKLRADFETAPASHLTAGWPVLPAEVPVDEPAGQALFETAVDQMDWTDDGDPRIYREDGQPVTGRDELDALEREIKEADEQYWIVPGIVQRYKPSPEPSDISEQLYCIDCGSVTGQAFVGYDGVAEKLHRGRPIWSCQACGLPRHEPSDGDIGAESYTQFDFPFEGPPGSSIVDPEILE
jgi:rubredoxin